jgi:galactose mutarotase-like enzyme
LDLAYVYDGTTHTGTLTAVGTDENGNPINYQIVFTYDDDDDTITINYEIANAEDEDTTISVPLVFHRDAANA